jgi:hypothetical protein
MLNKDKLEEMWEIQEKFNNKFYQNKLGKNISELTFDEKVRWTKNQILSIIKEATEVLDELPNWKEHRKENSEFIPSNLYEEIIDVNKFAVGLAQIWGMEVNKFHDEYLRKSWVVDQRWQQEQELNIIDKDAKVVGLDIDGVLGDYAPLLLKYIHQYLGKGWHFDSIHDAKGSLPNDKYEAIKTSYRQSGWKANMPAKEGAREFTELLKQNGYTIIILTARPYKKYSRIYPDTLQFLEINGIKYDAIIWDKDKHLKIMNEFPNLEFMVEDNPNIAFEIANSGYRVFEMESPEFPVDESRKYHHNIIPVQSFKEIADYL